MTITEAHSLFSTALERQRAGAAEALEDLLRTHTVDGDPHRAFSSWQRVEWKDLDEAELALRRFLQNYPA